MRYVYSKHRTRTLKFQTHTKNTHYTGTYNSPQTHARAHTSNQDSYTQQQCLAGSGTIPSHHVKSKHITPHHTTSQRMITSHHIASHHITSIHTTPHHITSHRTTSHHITHHNTSHQITSHHITRARTPLTKRDHPTAPSAAAKALAAFFKGGSCA